MEIPIKQSEPQGGRDIDGGWDGSRRNREWESGEIERGRFTCMTDARMDAAIPPMAVNKTSGSSPDAACSA